MPEEPVGDALEDFLEEANQGAATRAPSHEDDDESVFSGTPRDERRESVSREDDDAPAFSAEHSDDWKLDRAKERRRLAAANISNAQPRKNSAPTRA